MLAIAQHDACRLLSSGSKSLDGVISGFSDPLNGYTCISYDITNLIVMY